MTALDLDRLEALARDVFNSAIVATSDRRNLTMPVANGMSALVSEVRRLAAESEARRLVLVLKATELRQAEAEVERLTNERDEARATLEKEVELIQFERTLSEEERKKAYRSSQPEMAEYLLTCEHEWRKTADKLSDRCDERDRALARAERAEEALRLVVANMSGCETVGPEIPRPCMERYPARSDCWCPWCVAAAALSPLPAPQPAPEVKS